MHSFEDFFLSLKANHSFFTFLEQSTVLLLVTTALLCFFSFKSNAVPEFSTLQHALQIVCYIMIVVTVFSLFLVVTTHLILSRFRSRKFNVWGELVYETKKTMRSTISNEPLRKQRKSIIAQFMVEQKSKRTISPLETVEEGRCSQSPTATTIAMDNVPVTSPTPVTDPTNSPSNDSHKVLVDEAEL